jgi:hypothetical protein
MWVELGLLEYKYYPNNLKLPDGSHFVENLSCLGAFCMFFNLWEQKKLFCDIFYDKQKSHISGVHFDKIILIFFCCLHFYGPLVLDSNDFKILI